LPATKRNNCHAEHTAVDEQLELDVTVDARNAPDEQQLFVVDRHVVDTELDRVVGHVDTELHVAQLFGTELDVAQLFGTEPIEPERIVDVGNEQRDDDRRDESGVQGQGQVIASNRGDRDTARELPVAALAITTPRG
jgi:hypothetical protein